MSKDISASRRLAIFQSHLDDKFTYDDQSLAVRLVGEQYILYLFDGVSNNWVQVATYDKNGRLQNKNDQIITNILHLRPECLDSVFP